jgi:hypothetical protein
VVVVGCVVDTLLSNCGVEEDVVVPEELFV